MKHRVICFGEVLWDILPAGAVPGGAPMNVTYHLHKQNKHPALITRIGLDNEGRKLEAIFESHGVCTDYFQQDERHETGKVYAFPNEQHEMTYDIVKPVAWDFIDWKTGYAELVARAEYFIFGTLAARSAVSKNTLLHLLEAARHKVLDINLRAPYYDKNTLEELLSKTDFLKLNLHELELISSLFGKPGNKDQNIRSIADRFQIPAIVVTMGGEGASLFIEGNIYRHSGFRVTVADTVGSGDAFLAGLVSKLMEKEKPLDALTYANGLGALVATKTGGCPVYELPEVIQLIAPP